MGIEFIDKEYIGSVVQLKNTKNDLTLEGPINLVLKNLGTDIRVTKSENLDNILFIFTLNDGLNYEKIEEI